jgi:hypothetical protein
MSDISQVGGAGCRMIAGRPGRMTGQGLYDYQEQR